MDVQDGRQAETTHMNLEHLRRSDVSITAEHTKARSCIKELRTAPPYRKL
jgi:hypothetical protein